MTGTSAQPQDVEPKESESEEDEDIVVTSEEKMSSPSKSGTSGNA